MTGTICRVFPHLFRAKRGGPLDTDHLETRHNKKVAVRMLTVCKPYIAGTNVHDYDNIHTVPVRTSRVFFLGR